MPPRRPKVQATPRTYTKVVTPAPPPREWESFPGGKVGWSWTSRDWEAVPDDGRDKQGGFTSRTSAVEYLTNNRT